MRSIYNDIHGWAKLSAEDLDFECPGLVFKGEEDGALRFTVKDGADFIQFLDNCYVIDRFNINNGRAYYKDGTVLIFRKIRRCWEFVRYRKTYATVTLL